MINLSIRPQKMFFINTQKLISWILLAIISTVLLAFNAEYAHAAPVPLAYFDQTQPTPDVPKEVLIGEDFKFKVRFKNNSNVGDVGFGPYIELYLPAKGVDGNSLSFKCDGIRFADVADMLLTSPPTLSLLPPAYNSHLSPSTSSTGECPFPYSIINNPFPGMTSAFTNIPPGEYQRVVLELPFGSFNPSQPEVIVEITAHVSDYADEVVPTINPQTPLPLKIFTRGGFRYGASATGTSVIEQTPPFFAQTTPKLLKIKKIYAGPEDEAVSGPNFINTYPLKYKLGVDVADGQKIDNLSITDNLPFNLQFQGNVVVKIKGITATVQSTCSGSTGPLDVVVTPPPLGPGGQLQVELCQQIIGALPTPSVPNDVEVTFDFFIPQQAGNGQQTINSDCSNVPVTVENDILAIGNWIPNDPRDLPPGSTSIQILSDLHPIDHILKAKCLAIQKSAKVYERIAGQLTPKPCNLPLPVCVLSVPGDVIRYELQFQVSDYFSIGQLVVTDFLADGQVVNGFVPPPTFTVTDQFGTTVAPPLVNFITKTLNTPRPSFCPVNPEYQMPNRGTTLVFNISSAMALINSNPRHGAGILTGGLATATTSPIPATGTLVFFALIPPTNFQYPLPPNAGTVNIDKHDPINNCVKIEGNVLKNASPPDIPSVQIGSANDFSATHTTIQSDITRKSVYAIKRNSAIVCGPTPSPAACSNLPSSPEEVHPGDEVTYRIEKTLPSGDAEPITINDWLPLPIFTTALWPATSPPPPICPPILAVNTACKLPTHTVTAIPTITANQPTNSVAFNYPPLTSVPALPRKIDLLFTVQATNQPFADDLFLSNVVQECENDSFLTRYCEMSIAQVKVREPKLRIRKGVIATDNPKGLFTPPGSSIPSLPNAPAPAGVSFNLSGFTTTGTGAINSAALASGLLDSDLNHVDANDKVTFAVVIENQGGHPAYDVKLKDIIPNCLTNISNFAVKWGDGATIPTSSYNLTTASSSSNFSFSLIPGIDIPAKNSTTTPTGQNIIVITFQAQLITNISPGCCNNEIELQQYASQPGGPNFVTAGYTPPFKDTAKVCVNLDARKCVNATSEQHTLPDNSTPGSGIPQVAIGEIVRYRLTVALPEGSSPFFNLVDHLPPGLTYLKDGSTKVMFISNNGITSTAFAGSGLNVQGSAESCTTPTASLPLPLSQISTGPFTSGVDPVFSLGNLTNSDSDSDLEFVVVDFNALVNNLPINATGSQNQDGVALDNQYDVFVGKKPNGPADTSPIPQIKIVEPKLIVTKKIADTTGTPGNYVFEIDVTNNGTADAFDVKITDTLLPNFIYTPTATVTPTCGNTTLPPATIITSPPISAIVPQIPVSCSVKLKFTAKVKGKCVNNTADVIYTSLPNTGTVGAPNLTGSAVPPIGQIGTADWEREYPVVSGSLPAPLNCTGSLTVSKTFLNLTSNPLPAITFPITVNCLPTGPSNLLINLTAASPTQTINNLTSGTNCTVTESALPPPISTSNCASLGWQQPVYSAQPKHCYF